MLFDRALGARAERASCVSVDLDEWQLARTFVHSRKRCSEVATLQVAFDKHWDSAGIWAFQGGGLWACAAHPVHARACGCSCGQLCNMEGLGRFLLRSGVLAARITYAASGRITSQNCSCEKFTAWEDSTRVTKRTRRLAKVRVPVATGSPPKSRTPRSNDNPKQCQHARAQTTLGYQATRAGRAGSLCRQRSRSAMI
jgi:hypothetical protein